MYHVALASRIRKSFESLQLTYLLVTHEPLQYIIFAHPFYQFLEPEETGCETPQIVRSYEKYQKYIIYVYRQVLMQPTNGIIIELLDSSEAM